MTKVAIIGLGAMGKNPYRILSMLDNVEVCALCDVVQNDPYNEPFFHDVNEMLDTAKPDAVIIAVPTFLHKDVALKCTAKGIHIFIEKPAASTVEDAKEILRG